MRILDQLALFAFSLRTLRVRTRAFDPRVAGGMQVYHVAEGLQVYSVAEGVQVYSVINDSTCCFLLHLQLSKNYIKELNLDSTFN